MDAPTVYNKITFMPTYHIATITASISPILIRDPVWEKFLVQPGEGREPDFTAEYEGENLRFHHVRKIELGDTDAWLLIHDADVMAVSGDWRRGRIFTLENPDSRAAFLLQLFYAHAIRRRMIQLHASLVDWQGRGILFLGPSGIGKTTQAELWQRYRGARILNGDLVYVQEREDGFFGWGTPWHGSSPYCENDSVPICGLAVLKQGPENEIRPLGQFELLSQVADSLFYPQWVEGGMEICLEVADHLLERLPVWELSCRPDEGAVERMEETLMRTI